MITSFYKVMYRKDWYDVVSDRLDGKVGILIDGDIHYININTCECVAIRETLNRDEMKLRHPEYFTPTE